MIIILVVVVSLSGFKQKVSSDHFKNCTGETPHISRGVIVRTNNNLWRSVLSGLNLWGKVVISPASITHIANLNLNVLINLGATSFLILTVQLLLLLLFFIIIEEETIDFIIVKIKTTLLCMLLSLTCSCLGLILLIQYLVANLTHYIGSIFFLLFLIICFTFLISILDLILLLLSLLLLLLILSLLSS